MIRFHRILRSVYFYPSYSVLTHCMLGNFACFWSPTFVKFFLKQIDIYFRKLTAVSNTFDRDQALGTFVGPDLGQICLTTLPADHKRVNS